MPEDAFLYVARQLEAQARSKRAIDQINGRKHSTMKLWTLSFTAGVVGFCLGIYATTVDNNLLFFKQHPL